MSASNPEQVAGTGVLARDAVRDAAGVRLSVVVPALNESAYIGDCLRSLSEQDYIGGFEVVVVDNNSCDGTGDIARALGAVVVSEPREGVCSARHRGTQVARGEIVVSTDADTTFDRQWLSRIDGWFERRPDCVAVAGPCRFDNGPWWATVYPWLLFGLVHWVHRVTGHVCYVTATNLAFRRSQWTGYDVRLTQGGDELDALRRLQMRGYVAFDRTNVTVTSARRLAKGLVYNLVVTFGYYYALGYLLARIFRRPVLGTAPAFRQEPPPRRARGQKARQAWGWASRRECRCLAQRLAIGTGLLLILLVLARIASAATA